MVKARSRENTGTVERCADSRPRNTRNTKGRCTVVAIMPTVREIQAMEAQARHAVSVA